MRDRGTGSFYCSVTRGQDKQADAIFLLEKFLLDKNSLRI